MTYHSAILLEWDHGKFCTVVELATLHGVGGRYGKVNWYHDKLEKCTSLYRAMPPEQIKPWKGEFAEIRVSDVPVKSLDEFKDYVQQYTGPTLRFLDPHFTHSGCVRLSARSQADIARYLLNYMRRDVRYDQLFRSCQCFASDFYSFCAGKSGIQPFKWVSRMEYTNRSHMFIYEPTMYTAWLPRRYTDAPDKGKTHKESSSTASR